ncbi:hypothetical protein HYALB_00004703 [Hymenoscyphus albidus]|uniref:Uncharacterized protein n=1 Tax=Hymenoscyphus albidus TaxID=595503 RepID=A0A9N9M042_9HELO|nr:hypothetical protein HYALB_00004703 [Hymenoscyphus albidus]
MADTSLFNSTISQKWSFAGSTPLAPQIATKLLESFIPGYSTVHAFILEVFHFDTSVLVTAAACVLLAFRIGRYFWNFITDLLWNYWTSHVVLNSKDDAWTHVVFFLDHRNYTGRSRSLTMKTKCNYDSSDALSHLEFNGQWLNFSNQSSMRKPVYSLGRGTHWFRINGNYFRFSRDVDRNHWSGSRDMIYVTCYGRSTEPIKKLIVEAKLVFYKEKKFNNKKTSIYRPKLSYWYNQWGFANSRHRRPIDTIVLDQDIKQQILADINDYLHPVTERWYLFYGPPGTGKSSICFALAGIFGLDVYVMSLLKKGMNEEELGKLFTSLPTRCIVLLEDIDAADLSNRKFPEEESEEKSTEKAEDKSKKSRDEKKKEESGISLSALLNAIDGVASQEGRVLIMTTNKPESLDKALTRPGRVDMQMGFQNASQQQAREIFERMYIADDASTSTKQVSSPPTENPKSTDNPQGNVFPTPDEVKSLAQDFATRVPDRLFSPAELQGFSVKRKKEPKKALGDVQSWVEETQEQKKKGGKKGEKKDEKKTRSKIRSKMRSRIASMMRRNSESTPVENTPVVESNN